MMEACASVEALSAAKEHVEHENQENLNHDVNANITQADQTLEENHTLTEKTMDMLHNAAEKTMEIAQNVKETLVGSEDGENKEEGATFDNVINEDGSLEFMQENILKENDEDVFARKEKETRDQFSDDELKRIAEYGIMGFTMTDDPSAQPTQKIPLSHEKQD